MDLLGVNPGQRTSVGFVDDVIHNVESSVRRRTNVMSPRLTELKCVAGSNRSMKPQLIPAGSGHPARSKQLVGAFVVEVKWFRIPGSSELDQLVSFEPSNVEPRRTSPG